MEDISYRMQSEATKVFSALDKEVLRKMMGDMHRCAAKCCDNTTASSEDVERCRQTCEMPLQRAQEHMQQEVENFQSRVNRGIMDCNDSVRDKWSGKESQTDQLQMREEFEVCAKKCANEHISKLPELSKRLKAAIKNM